jgi:hypothetical protein
MVRLLRASIAGEASARSEHSRELGKQARERINTDFDVDNPTRPHEQAKSSSLPRHYCGPCPLLQCPRPGTCIARHRRSSSKRPYNRPRAWRPAFASKGARGTTGARKALRRQFMQAARWGSPPTKAGRRSGSGSLTRAGRPRTVTLAMSSMPGGRATRRHGRRQATTHGGVGATTAVRTTRQHRSPRGPACSAGRSARQASRSASASPRPSTSTQGRRTPVYGSTITAWHASWAVPPPTR